MVKHYQHTSLPYSQLWLLNDVTTPSSHGLENSKTCNKYHVNSITGVYPSLTLNLQSELIILLYTISTYSSRISCFLCIFPNMLAVFSLFSLLKKGSCRFREMKLQNVGNRGHFIFYKHLQGETFIRHL